MIIDKKPKYIFSLQQIILYIKKDKLSAAIKFEKELEEKINNLVNHPYMFRPSVYFNDIAYRDLVYKGYTVIYKVKDNSIIILEIFKWQNR